MPPTTVTAQTPESRAHRRRRRTPGEGGGLPAGDQGRRGTATRSATVRREVCSP